MFFLVCDLDVFNYYILACFYKLDLSPLFSYL